ncbi:tRNA lysidine(34) synthetase TilS [Anaplasmataceae bacterium AB001_6]|nr:tRNA lysidine(34) synthetase TilS [Anaplasmataceae bacterium AB001_6]
MTNSIHNIVLSRLSLILESEKSAVIAVSGGVDSMTLLDIISSSKKFNITVFSFDHALRNNSFEEVDLVKRYAHLNQLMFYQDSWNHNGDVRGNLLQQARNARYNALFKLCYKIKVQNIILAHHMDDQIETFLISLERGSSVDGLSCMSEVSTQNDMTILRPMLRIKKTQIYEYAKKHNIPWIEDQTNSNVKYKRAYIRKCVSLMQEDRDILYSRFDKTIQHMQNIKSALNYYVYNEAIKNAEIKIGYIIFNNEILQLPKEIYTRVFLYTIMIIGGKKHKPRYSSFCEFLQQILKYKKSSTLFGCYVLPSKYGIKFMREYHFISNDENIISNNKFCWDNRVTCVVNDLYKGLSIKKAEYEDIAAYKEHLSIKFQEALLLPVICDKNRNKIYLSETILKNESNGFILHFEYEKMLSKILQIKL